MIIYPTHCMMQVGLNPGIKTHFNSLFAAKEIGSTIDHEYNHYTHDQKPILPTHVPNSLFKPIDFNRIYSSEQNRKGYFYFIYVRNKQTWSMDCSNGGDPKATSFFSCYHRGRGGRHSFSLIVCPPIKVYPSYSPLGVRSGCTGI